jgi:hypothetical protein
MYQVSSLGSTLSKLIGRTGLQRLSAYLASTRHDAEVKYSVLKTGANLPSLKDFYLRPIFPGDCLRSLISSDLVPACKRSH